MTPEAQRIAIAQVCGWRPAPAGVTGEARWFPPLGVSKTLVACYIGALPNYLSDLNAMHEAEKVLTENQQQVFLYQLNGEIVQTNNWKLVHTTAAQRAEAFLRTLNLWDDSK